MKSWKVKEAPGKIFHFIFRRKKKENKGKSKLAKKMEPVVKIMNRFSFVFHFLLAFVLNFAIEAISRHSFLRSLDFLTGSPIVFLYNVFLIFLTFSFVYLVKRRLFTRLMISAVWLTLGIANGYMLSKRVTPFHGPDLKNALDFTTMINSYMSVLEIIMVVAGIVAVVLWLIFMWRRGPQYAGKVHRIYALIGVAVSCALYVFVTNMALEKRVLSNYFGNISFAFEDYGFPYCFTCSILETGISQPRGYSEESIENILASTETEETRERDPEEYPNIIVLQLESVFEPSETEFLELSEPALPTISKLKEEYSSGYFKVPSIGAGTANTEFEVLTGMNLRYFGPGEYPYKTILQQTTCESVAYNLNSLGYATHAMHNNGGNFYDRIGVFSKLGFDAFTSKEYMNITETTPNGWSKDDVLVEEIMDSLNSTENKRDFIFGITVQSHGDYPTNQVLPDPKIKVSGVEDEGKRNSWEYFVNQINEVDQMVADLIAELEKQGEPTVLVMYGDHLPTMGLAAEDVKSRYLYNTEYVIWDNIGLEKQDRNLTSYQLMSDVMERLDIHEGTIFKYHQNRRKTKNYLIDLEELQYDVLYGKQYAYGGENPFKQTELKMGAREVKITDVRQNANGDVIIRGENFTKYSKVNIGGERQGTSYVAPNVLRIEGYTLEDKSEITVDQVGSSNTTFSTTKPYTYTIPAEPAEEIPLAPPEGVTEDPEGM